MFLGGDQYRNNLSNNVIIKCHVCGNTNLKYLGYQRTPSQDIEKPYICGNGHETWGALDDWSIKGGTDKFVQEVPDCCCEGIQCEFPKSIFVSFSGIIGVQAREGSVTTNRYSDNLVSDFGTRGNMPYNMCYPCTTIVGLTGEEAFDPLKSNLESYNCGGFVATSGNVAYVGPPQEPATIWPYRVPTFQSAGYGATPFQLYYNKQTGFFDAVSHEAGGIPPYSCGCLDVAPNGFNFNLQWGGEYCGPTEIPDPDDEYGYMPPVCTMREQCTSDIYYPPCLEVGTYKCAGVDARYRVPCENPSDKYTINLGSIDQNSFDGVVRAFGGTPTRAQWFRCDFSTLLIRGVVPSPPSPCEDQGFNASVNVTTLLGNPLMQVDQPHCLRRVKSPNLASGSRYYAINTADLSSQRIILDRYYRTGGSIDYQWNNTLAKESVSPPAAVQLSGNDIENYGDLGFSDYQDRRLYPYPFTAHSGSLTEPELVAIIHSESGVGGQIAFDTFPVSYDSDDLMDVAYHQLKAGKGQCEWKHRITVHGYGVKYPLIDDPIWKENEIYSYPILLKGKKYKIGDKIEFRCWKALYDSDGNPIDNINNADTESVWSEECRELIVAKATITEVDDNGGIVWYEFDETDDNDDLLISVGNCPCDYDICSNPSYQTPFYEWDTNFSPESQCRGCLSKDVYPQKNHKIDALPDRISEDLQSIIPGKFPGYPNLGCISTGPYEYSFCQYLEPLQKECGENCQWTRVCVSSPRGPNLWADEEYAEVGDAFVLYEDDCTNTNCSCRYDPIIDYDPADPTGDEGSDEGIPRTGDPAGTVYPSQCICSPRISPIGGDIAPYILPSDNPTLSPNSPSICFPKNNTWDWYAANYARSACSGDPVTPEQRPYMDNILTIPPKKAQYRYEWIPKVQCTLDGIENWITEKVPFATEIEIAIEKDEFLLTSGEGCNPLNIDVYGKSYKFPLADLQGEIDKPCRLQNNYAGIGTLYVKYSEGSCSVEPQKNINSDNYCRVYGFYQQRQPTCDVVYKGQYILRAAQKLDSSGPFQPVLQTPYFFDTPNNTDCEPVIDNITIFLTKKESRFDVTVGAPYDQRFLIPENLPTPQIGPDGKLECTADSWNDPSLNGNDNTRLFNHGFHTPVRKYFSDYKIIPGESLNNNDPFRVDIINPVSQMQDVDGNDLFTLNNEIQDMYINGVWDLPNPRSNVRIGTTGLEPGDPCVNPSYTGIAFSGFPTSGRRWDYSSSCPYPWEYPASEVNFDCMFKNNSAKIVLGSIKECDYCTANEVLIFDPADMAYIGQSIDLYDIRIYYTYGIQASDSSYQTLLFRCFGSSEGSFSKQTFVDLVQEYLDIWVDRLDIDISNLSLVQQIYTALINDTERTIFWNFIFNGANNDKLDNLTRVEVIAYDANNPPVKWLEERRCEFPKRAGSVESLIVQNPGEGYAFEIHERVPPTDVRQNILGATISVTTKPQDLWRRFETYKLDSVNIEGSGCCYEINDIVPIRFDDPTDYKQYPSVKVTEVNDSGVILNWEISNSGEFYKYAGTGEHRAFPVSIVVDNYWNIPGTTDSVSKLGKHALFRPVIGVDPSDPGTYGKIKRVEIEYGGIEYVEPNVYWVINTTAGNYDDEGDLISGLDIQHLVDPCKYNIDGNGMSSEAIAAYRQWYALVGDVPVSTIGDSMVPDGYFDNFSEIQFPDRWNYPKPDQSYSFKDSTKYYYKTRGNQVIKWSDRVKSWSTVIQSGFCPFGPDGLLNRTYEMALVEEVDLTGQDASFEPWRPFVGTCSQDLCDYIINNAPTYPSPIGQTTGAWLCDRMPQEEGSPLPNLWLTEIGGDTEGGGSYADCHYLGCNIFTIYDAHRFPIIGVDGTGAFRPIGSAPGNWAASRRPKIQGCLGSTVPEYGDWCVYGYKKAGFINIEESLAQDKCFNSAEYSLFAEFAKYIFGLQIYGTMRAKAITYKMKDPITMTVSYNDNTVPEYPPCGDAYCLTTITNFSYVDRETIYSEFGTFEQLCKKYCGEDGWNPTGNSCSCDFDCPGDGCSYSIVPGECT